MTQKEKRDLITARNLLSGRSCGSCELEIICTYKLKESHNTCGKWKEHKPLDISFSSYNFNAKPRKLKVTWTQESEILLEQFSHVGVEDELIKAASKEIKEELKFETLEKLKKHWYNNEK